jgi:hypothetical protein
VDRGAVPGRRLNVARSYRGGIVEAEPGTCAGLGALKKGRKALFQ